MEIEACEQRVAGYRTYFQAAGEGHPVVLVHGLGGSSLTYGHNITALAQDFRVYVPDLPGHGLSEKPDISYSVESAVPFITAFIEDVCGAPAALVGISAGGLIGALTAAAAPRLVSHLVLVCPAGFGRRLDPALRLLTLPAAGRLFERTRATRAGVQLALRRTVYDQACVTDEMVDLLCEERAYPGTAPAMLRALRSNVGLSGARRWQQHLRTLRQVQAPVMIIWGRQDRVVPVSYAYRAWRWLGKRADLQFLDRCGHWPPYECPERFNQLVRDFLRK